jgi:predicted NBD/HSP70 family sugar kinase
MQKKRASNLEVKRINRNQVYAYIKQHRQVSKQEIASALAISVPTVLQNVDELMERGLVQETGTFASTGGRKAKILSPVCSARTAIGIDITQNHVGLALTDLSGEALTHKRQLKPFANTERYYRELADLALSFLRESQCEVPNFLGFGISIPGIISRDNTIITHSHALNIRNVPCRQFSEFIPYPCIFTNDANAAMIAEMDHDPATENAIYLSLSNYVGGAIFTRSPRDFELKTSFEQLFLGENCRSGEFGHMTLYPGGETCYCSKSGCVDAYCSAKVLASLTEGRLEQFFASLPQSAALSEVWDLYLDRLAIVANSLRMAFDCPLIIGGYVGAFMEPYLDDLRRRAARLNTFEDRADFIRLCHFKYEASALGAALRHIEAFIRGI